MKRYLVVFERTASGYSAHVPDLPGCATAGETIGEAEANMREAINEHIDMLRAAGDPIPTPSAHVSFVVVGT